MSRGLDSRIGRLEERQAGGVDREKEFARDRALHQRVRECAREDPELYTAYQNALDDYLDAEEKARRRSETTGEDPEEAPEVLETIRAYEQIERRLLGENDDEGRRRH